MLLLITFRGLCTEGSMNGYLVIKIIQGIKTPLIILILIRSYQKVKCFNLHYFHMFRQFSLLLQRPSYPHNVILRGRSNFKIQLFNFLAHFALFWISIFIVKRYNLRKNKVNKNIYKAHIKHVKNVGIFKKKML